MVIKRLNVKNRKYYLYNDLINIKYFDPSLLRLDKKESAGFNIITRIILEKNLGI